MSLALTLAGAASLSAETLYLGAPIPATGPFSSDGEAMEKGIKLAVEDINADGGLLGTEIEVLVFDIGDLTPDKLQAAAANLVERNESAVLINGYGGMGPDIPAFCPYDVPYIHNDATSNVVELRDRLNCGNIFMGSDTDYNYGRYSVRQVLEMGHDFASDKIALINGPFDWELNAVRGAKDEAEEKGWQVVLEEEVPYDTKQWRGLLSKLRDAGPSLIYLELLDPASVKTFIDQFNEDPVPGALVYVGYTASVPAFRAVVEAGAANGVLGMTLSSHRDDEKGQAFVERWREAYGEEPPLSIAAQIYDEVQLWAAAVREVGDVNDHQGIADVLRTITYEGITGTFVFNEQQYIDLGDDTLPPHLIQAQDGKQVQVMIGSEQITPFKRPNWLD
ncbi:MAG: ABC transporter substrate-binding protein [Geminicoccaceae bacterium]